MLGSTIIDVAIGIVLTFLGVSLAASAVTEAISSFLKLRENTLLAGIKQILNDPGFEGTALQLYNHALVNPLASGLADSIKTLQHKPAYIDARDFARAFYDVVVKSADKASVAGVIDSIADPQLKSVAQTLWTAAGQDIEKFKSEIGHWFDHAMDRLSGWYKTKTQWISFLVALVIAGAINANVLYEGAQIWSRPGLIANIEAGAFGKMDDALKACDLKVPTPAATADPSTPDANCAAFKGALDELKAANLIGWMQGPRPTDPWTWVTAILSWLVVAGSTLFGASFWFDILQRLSQLRGTGLVAKKMDGTTSKPDIASPATPPDPDQKTA